MDEKQEGTWAVGALVVRMTLESWGAIKAAVEREGGKVVFQRTGPRGTLLWIVERDPREVSR